MNTTGVAQTTNTYLHALQADAAAEATMSSAQIDATAVARQLIRIPGVRSVTVEPAAPYPAMPASSGAHIVVNTIMPATQGYALSAATPTAAAKATAATTSKATSTSTSTTLTAKELAFLDDKKLSIEDKLFRFMALVTKKADQELVNEMKAYAGKANATQSAASAKQTVLDAAPASNASAPTVAPAVQRPPVKLPDGSLNAEARAGDWTSFPQPYADWTLGKLFQTFDPMQIMALHGNRDPNGIDTTSALSRIGDAVKDVADAALPVVADAVKDYAGPALAALVTSLGQPELAPAALALGSELGKLGKSALSGQQGATAGATSSPSSSSRSSSSGSSASSSSSVDTTMDEKVEFLNLQRLAEKQQTMFAALSNVLKSFHDSQMAVVNNIR